MKDKKWEKRKGKGVRNRGKYGGEVKAKEATEKVTKK